MRIGDSLRMTVTRWRLAVLPAVVLWLSMTVAGASAGSLPTGSPERIDGLRVSTCIASDATVTRLMRVTEGGGRGVDRGGAGCGELASGGRGVAAAPGGPGLFGDAGGFRQPAVGPEPGPLDGRGPGEHGAGVRQLRQR